jgi:hypothetical protein
MYAMHHYFFKGRARQAQEVVASIWQYPGVLLRDQYQQTISRHFFGSQRHTTYWKVYTAANCFVQDDINAPRNLVEQVDPPATVNDD